MKLTELRLKALGKLTTLAKDCLLWWAFLWLKWAGLPPAVLGPSILSKGVETGSIATQFGPTCAQTMPRLPGARLRRAKHGAYPLFLLQKELFSSFCRKRNFSPVFATRLTFLLCSKTFCCAIKLPAVQ